MARSNARLEVSGAGKTEDGLVQYNEEVNKLGDDLRELYETIRVNVDEEEQWKVFDFVEDFFMEELEIGDYINDINSYHLHMFGKHDVTTKKLDVIVEKAGKVDANYAAQIEGYCSLLGEYGKKFEAVCAMFALDLIGVKVFRYSDETAEAVASGEKLLKESGTIYESSADMMSPEDAKRYLDFLENGSREGLTSAELADALLVSQKVGYEDVWDLRNAGDVLESGRKGGLDTSIKNIDEFIGGNKSFDDVLDDYAKVYADKINSNQAWSWDDTIPGGENLTKKQRSIIKQQAIDAGLITDIKVTKVEGMRYGFADFESAGVVKETQYLPENMWKMSNAEQFKWLDEQIGGTVDGYTWHHTEIPGKMQLVPTGIHNITTHNGGRTAGMWADAPR